MELHEEITALKAEKEQYIKIIEDVRAEALALDNMYVESLKESMRNRKELILINNKLKDLTQQLEVKQNENEVLVQQIKDFNRPYEAPVESNQVADTCY